MPSSHHQNLFASQISEPRKSILPSFDDDNDSPPSDTLSAYTLDFDFSEFNTHLFPSPQFETFLAGSYLEDKKKKKSTNPPLPVRPNKIESAPPPGPDVKLSSFAELEEDCSALQFDSEVIVLTRPRTHLDLPFASRAPTPAPASQTQAVPPRTQPSSIARKESKYQRNAPPHLHLKSSNYDHYRRSSRRFSSRRDTRSSASASVGPPPNPNEITSPAPTQLIDSTPNTPKSFRAFRISYASSKSSKRGSRIHFSTKELHRRRILKLQRTFGERVPLELVAVSPARRRRRRNNERPPSMVSYRGPYALVSPTGGPTNPSVGDWTLDRIAPPPPPPVKPKSSCGIFRNAVVVGPRNRRNTLRRKSGMRMSRKFAEDESFEVIEREEALEGEDEEDDVGQDRRETSIWLDEDSPLPHRSQPSPRLVPAHRYYEGLTAIRTTEMFYDHAQSSSDMIIDMQPSRPISEVSIADMYTSRVASHASSPSMPAFYHGSDSDHTHLQHQQRQQRQQQQQQQQYNHPPVPNTPAGTPMPMLSPALFWPRMPFSAPLAQPQQVVSSTTPDTPFGPYDLSLFEDVQPVVLSTSRRSERRQGWSGEWNQPSIRDVIQKLRNI